jgi:hypothetical protein
MLRYHGDSNGPAASSARSGIFANVIDPYPMCARETQEECMTSSESEPRVRELEVRATVTDDHAYRVLRDLSRLLRRASINRSPALAVLACSCLSDSTTSTSKLYYRSPNEHGEVANATLNLELCSD